MDVRISQLPEPKHLTPGDLIPLVSHGDNVAISLEHFLFEISHILDNVPCSAIHIAKDAKVKALQAITKAQEAYTIAKNAYNASDEATQKVTEVNEKTTTNANDIATLKVDKVTIQAQISNLEQILNSTADDLRITVTTQVTPSATKYLFKRGETIVATVVVPDVDTSLTMAGSAADAKATGDAIQNVRDSIPTKVSEFANDANYLTEGNANQKYLSKTEAQSTYLTQRAAENTYLSKTDASVIYPSKVEVANDYLNKNDAANIYLSQKDASNTYLNKAVATTKLNQLESTLTDTTETTHILNDKYIALSRDVDTNKHSIVDLDNRLTTQEQKEVKVICNNATIGTTLTTIGSVNGVDIKARVNKQDVSVGSSDAEIGTSLTTIATVDGKEIKARVAPVNIVNKDATLSDTLTTIATINGVNINVKLPQGGVVVDSLDAGIGGDLTTIMVINGKEVKTKVNTDTELSKTSSNPIANSTVATSIEDLTNKYNDLATKYTQLLNSFQEITGNTVSAYFNS